jgi:glycosyltransferase involved in cell wall biosynthesis
VIYQEGHVGTKAVRLVDAYVRRLASVRSLDGYDGVLVYREAALLGPALVERFVARRKPIIYQLDDPLYVPYRSPSSGWFSYLKFFGKVGTICRLSQVAIVNSEQHAEYARRFTDNVVVIPSVVDGDLYPGWTTRRPGAVRIGWSGSTTTVANLQVIAGALREISSRDDVSLRFIGTDRAPIPELVCEAQPWRADSEVADLQQFDIGLLPVPVTPWNKRKFFLKLVQYMALGIPAVCTPLGSALDAVEPGVTGFLADTQQDWVSSLERLVEDAELRERMGIEAARRAHERFTLQANADRIVSAFRSAIG